MRNLHIEYELPGGAMKEPRCIAFARTMARSAPLLPRHGNRATSKMRAGKLYKEIEFLDEKWRVTVQERQTYVSVLEAQLHSVTLLSGSRLRPVILPNCLLSAL